MITPTSVLTELNRLTEEEQDLYYSAFCFFCSAKLETQEEYNDHICAAKSAVKSYYKEEDFN